MFELKPLTVDAIPRALEKAERYRLLNEPAEAESICEDVLRIDPDNQQALVMLLLALTEQFDDGIGGHLSGAREACDRLAGKYERAYFRGIIWERHGKAHFRIGGHGAGTMAHECIRQAMSCYEEAEAVRPQGNDDALLRWNACARLLMRAHAEVPEKEERFEPFLE